MPTARNVKLRAADVPYHPFPFFLFCVYVVNICFCYFHENFVFCIFLYVVFFSFSIPVGEREFWRLQVLHKNRHQFCADSGTRFVQTLALCLHEYLQPGLQKHCHQILTNTGTSVAHQCYRNTRTSFAPTLARQFGGNIGTNFAEPALPGFHRQTLAPVLRPCVAQTLAPVLRHRTRKAGTS